MEADWGRLTDSFMTFGEGSKTSVVRNVPCFHSLMHNDDRTEHGSIFYASSKTRFDDHRIIDGIKSF